MALAAAITASSTAAAAYLDAKLHIRQDVRLLWRWRSVQRELRRNAEANSLSCLYFFEESVARFPHVEAIWSREGSYTFKETQDRAYQYAAFFQELGVAPGQTVAFCLSNSPDIIFAWLGLWALGCAPAMINFNLTGDALVHCLRISGSKVVLVDDSKSIRDAFDNETKRIREELGMTPILLSKETKQEISAKPIQRPDDSYRAGVTLSFPGAIFYTSGTTGLPKGAVFSTERMQMGGCARGIYPGQKPGPDGEKWYICMPLYHGTGGISAMVSLMAGISVAIGKGFSVRNFWKDVHDSESTFIVYVGETARYLLAAPPGPYDKNHKVRCMYGNGLRPDVWTRFQERFNVPEVAEFFNSSEGMLSMSVHNRGDYTAECIGHHGALLRYLMRNIYVPVQIDHETNDIVRDPKTGYAKRASYNEGGEIIVKLLKKQQFPGYWNNAEATEKKFITDVFEKGDLYYRSGDALRRTDDGRWFFLDRLGDTYRWKSENVSTAEVAEVLGRLPGIAEANVYGVNVPGHEGRAGCAALSIAPDVRENFDWNTFYVEVRKRLPKYAVPVFVRVLKGEVGGAASHNNKQDKVRLRAEGVDPGLRGTKVKGGGEDEMFWLKPGVGRYVRFEQRDWEGLVGGRAKL